MKRIFYFLWFCLLGLWCFLHFGKRIEFRESWKPKTFQHSPKVWIGPSGVLQEYHYYCANGDELTGEELGEVYSNGDGTWKAWPKTTLGSAKVFSNIQEAKSYVESEEK